MTDKTDMSVGVKFCSKCEYNLRCEECVYKSRYEELAKKHDYVLCEVGKMKAAGYGVDIKAVRAEAIIEFAENLKERYSEADILCPRRIVSLTEKTLDNLVNEITGSEAE